MDVPKKKGRPRKIKEENKEVVVEKKKRGRKKKERLENEESVKEKKKRGRKATLKFFSSSIRKKIPLVSEIQDNDQYICHLDINSDEENEKSDISVSPLQNQQLISNYKTNTQTTTDIQDAKKSNKYIYMSQFMNFDPKGNWEEKTNICCWWCCHQFETIPLGLPVSYDKFVHKFRTRGIFCSFSCMVSFDKDSYNNKNKYFIHQLYSKLTGKFCTKNLTLNSNNEYKEIMSFFLSNNLKPAPPKFTLKMFGGDLTIENFRNASKEDRIYRMVKYPMYISRDYIEEIDIKNLKNVNKKLFSTQQHIPKTLIDTSKIQELKKKIKSSVIISTNSIDKFISVN